MKIKEKYKSLTLVQKSLFRAAMDKISVKTHTWRGWLRRDIIPSKRINQLNYILKKISK